MTQGRIQSPMGSHVSDGDGTTHGETDQTAAACSGTQQSGDMTDKAFVESLLRVLKVPGVRDEIRLILLDQSVPADITATSPDDTVFHTGSDAEICGENAPRISAVSEEPVDGESQAGDADARIDPNTSEGDRDALLERIAVLKRQLSEASDALSKSEKQLKAVSEERDSLKNDLTSAESNNEELSAQLASALSKQDETQKLLDAESMRQKELKDELKCVKQERDLRGDRINELVRDLNGRKTELTALSEEKKETERENDVLRTRLESAERELGPFSRLLREYASFMSLADSRREKLRNVLDSSDPVAFISDASQRDTIFHLWDYMKVHMNDLTEKELAITTGTLQYLIELYNMRWSGQVYEMMTAETGRPFDDQRHTRGAGCSVYQGNIERILLPGIWNSKTGSAERKSIVYYGR